MKKLFMKKAPKEATEQENKDYLESIGVSTFKGNRERKFGGFSDYARELAAKGKKDYNAPGVGADTEAIYQKQQQEIYGPGGNPYAQARADKQAAAAQQAEQAEQAQRAQQAQQAQQGQQANPYLNQNSYESAANPYAQAASAGANSNPYGVATSGNPYQSAKVPAATPAAAPVAADASANPYGAAPAAGANPYSSQASQYAESTYAPSNAREELFGRRKHNFEETYNNEEELDELNAAPDGELDELNQLPDQPQQAQSRAQSEAQAQQQLLQQQQDEEDEELEELRNQIKFTKKESLSSTQNTLRLAAEAEASGRNALGMLGSQGERIANTERSLALAKNQTKIATEKNAELARLNRSIFVPNVGNPFTSKRRLQEKEARIKSEYAQEQVAREHRRQNAFESERRVIDGLNSNGVSYSETAMKHKKEQMRNNEGRKKFQFEADSEDEDLEDELELNLEGISNAAGRMKGLAQSMGDEVESQNRRLERITRQTDELDIDVHLNAARLAAIK